MEEASTTIGGVTTRNWVPSVQAAANMAQSGGEWRGKDKWEKEKWDDGCLGCAVFGGGQVDCVDVDRTSGQRGCSCVYFLE
eukprot:6263797-Ditylum_brightwellii.AAC.1